MCVFIVYSSDIANITHTVQLLINIRHITYSRVLHVKRLFSLVCSKSFNILILN